MPRFADGNAQANAALVAELRELAAAKRVTTAQLAIAWVASRGSDIIPLIGARRRDQLTEGLAGVALSLTDAELAAIELSVPADAVAGDRYGAPQMADLDSER
jgi:aryl-alcohol dehydrogenase-like predicted oxidoreductase